jgi:hypothetical protein
VWAYFDPREVADPHGWSRAMRAYGVVAMPDLALDDWEVWKDAARGLPAVPVKLPADIDAWPEAIRTWEARTAGGPPAFAIPIDEPRRLWQKLVVRERAALAGDGTFLYAVTDTPHFVYGGAVDLFITPYDVTLEHPGWTYGGTPPYAGSMVLDTDGTALRTWGWIGWRWRVPVWYVWDAAYWRDRYHHRDAVDPAKDAITFDDGDDHGNLDGVLAWQADDGSFEPSLRLEELRRGLQDRALLELYERCAGRDAADAIAAPLVPRALGDAGPPGRSGPGAWPTAEAPWEAARAGLLDAIRSARCR